MSDAAVSRHGLENLLDAVESADEARVDVSVLSGRGFLNLRLDPQRREAVDTVARVLGQPLPLAANTFTSGEHRVYWLGPDEWLIQTDAERASNFCSELGEAFAGVHAAINDVSGGHVAIGLGGEYARTVLVKGCTLDLHPRVFRPGQCARTGLAKATILLAFADDEPAWTITVARSYADYLCRWLAHAARPHGIRFSMP